MRLNIFYYKEKREQRFLNDLQNPDNRDVVIDFLLQWDHFGKEEV